MNTVPLLIEFVSGTHVYREPTVVSPIPLVHNGPPGTFVVFGDGGRVALPTDQIVFTDDDGGVARVGFGGMSPSGMEDGRLIFDRVRDLQPDELLSPERGRRMTLDPRQVTSVTVHGQVVWPDAPVEPEAGRA